MSGTAPGPSPARPSEGPAGARPAACRVAHLGLAEGRITPSVPVPMGGYGARSAPSQGVHDDLTAHALFLDDVLWLCLDLLCLTAPDATRVRAVAAQAADLPPERVLVSCTHTHAGPATVALPPQRERAEAYMRALPGLLAPLAQAAAADTRPAVVMPGAFVSRVGADRRREAGRVEQVNTFWAIFSPDDDRLLGLLLQTACHPTVLPPANLQVSADYLGGLRAAWHAAHPGVWLAVVNGACGDISTRFTRREQTFAEAWRLGAQLQRELDTALADLQTARAKDAAAGRLPEEARVALRRQRVALPQRTLPGPEEAQARAAAAQARWEAARPAVETGQIPPAQARILRTAFEGAVVEASLAAHLRELECEADVAVIDLGQTGAVLLPGELFDGVGGAIRRGSPWATTMVAGYANGHIGYVPTRRAYAEGGYEALSSHLAPGAGEQLAEAAGRLAAGGARR